MACIYEDITGSCTLMTADLQDELGACTAVGDDYDECLQSEPDFVCADCMVDLNFEECKCHESFCDECLEPLEECVCL